MGCHPLLVPYFLSHQHIQPQCRSALGPGCYRRCYPAACSPMLPSLFCALDAVNPLSNAIVCIDSISNKTISTFSKLISFQLSYACDLHTVLGYFQYYTVLYIIHQHIPYILQPSCSNSARANPNRRSTLPSYNTILIHPPTHHGPSFTLLPGSPPLP